MTESSFQTRKPWPMWVVVACIAAFVLVYTVLMLQFRKAEPPYLPYEESRLGELHSELRRADWRPFPNAYATDWLEQLLVRFDGELATVPFSGFTGEILVVPLKEIVEAHATPYPPVREVEAPLRIGPGQPYPAFVRFTGESPQGRGERHLFYRKDRSVVMVPREPRERTDPQTGDEIGLLIPPEQLTPGTWRFFLYTEDGFVFWNFLVEE